MNKQYEMPAYIRRERDGLLKTLGMMSYEHAGDAEQAFWREEVDACLKQRERKMKRVYRVLFVMIAAAAAWLAWLLVGETAGLLMRSFFESAALWGGVWLACTKLGLV